MPTGRRNLFFIYNHSAVAVGFPIHAAVFLVKKMIFDKGTGFVGKRFVVVVFVETASGCKRPQNAGIHYNTFVSFGFRRAVVVYFTIKLTRFRVDCLC